MVSHAESPAPGQQNRHRALTHRAPSVSSSSRSLTHRRHRGSRSHSGGTSYRPQNEFPVFAQTGDVEIVIRVDGHERSYVLHRLILSQASGFFEASTSEEWSRIQQNGNGATSNSLARIGEDGSNKDREGSLISRPPPSAGLRPGEKIRWRYELDQGNDPEEIPMLVRKPLEPASLFGTGSSPQPPPPSTNKPPPSSYSFFRSMSNFSGLPTSSSLTKSSSHSGQDNDTIRDYDNLFRIFYNYPPALDAVNIAESYIQCKSLLNLADMYDALEVVGPRIDHHLLQFQGRLWKQIAKYPPSYLKLGYLARSKVIFAEALVHVVGQWPSGANQLRHNVPDTVLEIIEDKVDELAERRMRIEAKLFCLSLTNTKGDRVSPSTGYTDWLALSLFRQWLADNLAPAACNPVASSNPSSSASASASGRSVGSMYRKLGTGRESYLDHDDCKRFFKLRPDESGSRDALRRFEKRIYDIKEIVREIVSPLMKNYLELDIGRDAPGGSLGHLTCTKVDEEDYPWD